MYMKEVKELSPEEMDIICDEFGKLFPDMNNLTIIHEKESEEIHADIGILYSNNRHCACDYRKAYIRR